MGSNLSENAMTATSLYGLPQMSRAADNGDLRSALASVLNRHSRENGSNTPDWILAQYLANCLDAYDVAVGARAQWYGRVDSIGGPLLVPRVAEHASDCAVHNAPALPVGECDCQP